MDEGIVQIVEGSERKEVRVLILVVVDNGLVLSDSDLRPVMRCLVLILVVVEDGLVLKVLDNTIKSRNVLILVVVEDGLVLRELWRSTLRLERS